MHAKMAVKQSVAALKTAVKACTVKEDETEDRPNVHAANLLLGLSDSELHTKMDGKSDARGRGLNNHIVLPNGRISMPVSHSSISRGALKSRSRTRCANSRRQSLHVGGPGTQKGTGGERRHRARRDSCASVQDPLDRPHCRIKQHDHDRAWSNGTQPAWRA